MNRLTLFYQVIQLFTLKSDVRNFAHWCRKRLNVCMQRCSSCRQHVANMSHEVSIGRCVQTSIIYSYELNFKLKNQSSVVR